MLLFFLSKVFSVNPWLLAWNMIYGLMISYFGLSNSLKFLSFRKFGVLSLGLFDLGIFLSKVLLFLFLVFSLFLCKEIHTYSLSLLLCLSKELFYLCWSTLLLLNWIFSYIFNWGTSSLLFSFCFLLRDSFLSFFYSLICLFIFFSCFFSSFVLAFPYSLLLLFLIF